VFLYYRECYSPSISVTLLGVPLFFLLNIMKHSSPALLRKKVSSKLELFVVAASFLASNYFPLQYLLLFVPIATILGLLPRFLPQCHMPKI